MPLFNSATAATQYVFVGNSIGTTTGGSGTTTIATQFASAADESINTVVNNCAVGEKLSTTLTNFAARVGNYAQSITGRPLIVIVVASAGSDVFGDGTTGDSAATAWATIQSFCSAVQAIGGKVVISTVPYGDYWAGAPARNTVRLALNVLIRAGTSSYNWLWDMELLYPVTTASYFGADFQHLSDSGKQIGANSLVQVLSSNYNGASPIIFGGVTIGPINANLTPTGGFTFASDNGSAGATLGSAQATRELQLVLPGSAAGLKILASDKSTLLSSLTDAGVWQLGTKVQLAGTTASFPMLKRSGTIVQLRLSDDSGDAGLTGAAIETSQYFNMQNDGCRFYFGQGTSAFPSLKRSATVCQVRLGDDSNFAPIQGFLRTAANATTGLTAGVLAALTNATVVITDASGQAYRVPCII